MWEAGLGYHVTPDLDINAGYRYLNTKLGDKGSDTFNLNDDSNISYKGFIAGVSYRFGGGPKEEAPEPAAPVYTPAPAPAPVYTPAPTQAPANDYYLESVHFGFDEDQPLASEKPRWTTSSRLLKQTRTTPLNSSVIPTLRAAMLTTMTFLNAA